LKANIPLVISDPNGAQAVTLRAFGPGSSADRRSRGVAGGLNVRNRRPGTTGLKARHVKAWGEAPGKRHTQTNFPACKTETTHIDNRSRSSFSPLVLAHDGARGLQERAEKLAAVGVETTFGKSRSAGVPACGFWRRPAASGCWSNGRNLHRDGARTRSRARLRYAGGCAACALLHFHSSGRAHKPAFTGFIVV
jgi:hypothetical protein